MRSSLHRLAGGLALGACLGVAPRALAGDCFGAISATTAQQVFDALAKTHPIDGCTLENVATDKAQMKIEWMKNGKLQEAILVVPTACVREPTTTGKFSTIVPPSTEAACPWSVDATNAMIDSASMGETVATTEAIVVPDVRATVRRPRRRLVYAGAAGLALAVALGVFVALRFRAKARALAAQNRTPPIEPPVAPSA